MKHADEQAQPAAQPVAPEGIAPEQAGPTASEGGALVEPPGEAVARLGAELAALKDRHLRLAAEYDNFRKRTAKERSGRWAKAQAGLPHRLVGRVADPARFPQSHPTPTEPKA